MNQLDHSQEPSWACAPLLLKVKLGETNLGLNGTSKSRDLDGTILSYTIFSSFFMKAWVPEDLHSTDFCRFRNEATREKLCSHSRFRGATDSSCSSAALHDRL